MSALLSISVISLAGIGPALLGYSRVRHAVPLPLIAATAWFMGAGSISLIFYLFSLAAGRLMSLPSTAVSLFLSLACGIAWWRMRIPAASGAPPSRVPVWQSAIGACAFLFALINLGIASGYAVATPFLAWDAWAHWILIPRHWAGLDAITPLMALPEWLNSSPGDGRFVTSWNSPLFLPLLVTWSADLAGGWNERQLSALWPATNAAIMLCMAGWLRWRAVNWAGCALGAYVVSGTPMVVTHTAFAGYADIWLGGVFLTTCTVAAVANDDRRRPELLVLAVALAALAVFIKPAGAVWSSIALGTMVAVHLSWRLITGIAALTVVAVLTAGLLGFELFGLSLKVSAWHDVSGPFLRILLLYPDWQLLVPLFLVALLVSFVRRPSAGETTLAIAAGAGLAFTLAALALTRYGEAADTLTLINRTIMPGMLPLTAFGCSVLCHQFFSQRSETTLQVEPAAAHSIENNRKQSGRNT